MEDNLAMFFFFGGVAGPIFAYKTLFFEYAFFFQIRENPSEGRQFVVTRRIFEASTDLRLITIAIKNEKAISYCNKPKSPQKLKNQTFESHLCSIIANRCQVHPLKYPISHGPKLDQKPCSMTPEPGLVGPTVDVPNPGFRSPLEW